MDAPNADWEKELAAADAAVAGGEVQRACAHYEAVARAVNAAPGAAPARDVLVLRQPWFGFGLEELALALREAGLTAAYAEADVAPGRPDDWTVDASWASATHRGVPLWEVARADFCVRHELSLASCEAFAAENPDLLAAELARAVVAIDRLARLIDAFRPGVVVFAQGHVLASAAARALAISRGIRVLALENTLHAGRLLSDSGAGLPVQDSDARRDWLRHGATTRADTAARYARDYLSRARTLKTAQHATSDGAPPPASPGRKRIVYLAQVSTDASVLFGIGAGFGAQVDVIRALASHAGERGHELVVKLHPKEHAGDSPLGIPYRQLTLRHMQADRALAAALQSGAFHVDADNTLDTAALIESADLCVTVNSQAGLEALLQGKELVCCGRAFYAAAETLHAADDPRTLAACVDRVLDRDLRRNAGDATQRFFHVYMTRTCIDKTPAAIAARLVTLGDGHVPEAPSPVENAYDSGERQTALYYDEIRADHRARYEFAADALSSVGIGAGSRGLDAFCGNGYGTHWLASRTGAQLLGIDGCDEAIDVAEECYGADGIAYQALHFPFELPVAEFDFVTCFESIEHVEDGATLLATLARALKPGGLLFLSTPNEAALPLRDNAAFFGFHYRHFEREELLELAAEYGLAPRLELGQDVYRTRGTRAHAVLPPEEMGLRETFECPHFLIHVFERLGRVAAADADGRVLDLRDAAACQAAHPAGSADGIRVGEAFVELGFRDGRHAIEGWQDALAPGGLLELVLPDLRHHAAQLLDASGSAETRRAATAAALAGLWGAPEGDATHAHCAGYDFATLRAILLQRGFVDVIRVPDAPERLRVLAWKPAQP